MAITTRALIPSPRVRLRINPSLLPREIELQVGVAAIQWRLVGDAAWTDLIDIADLAATVAVGTVTALTQGSPPTVVNVGTDQNVILNFGIPTLASPNTEQIITTGNVTVAASDRYIVLNKAAPAATVVTLPAVVTRNGLALTISDWGGNAGDVTITPNGTEKVMGLSSATLGSGGQGLGTAATITLYPDTTLGGWFQ